ncbi:MAG: methylenetetrahydrofolate reductase, partial [Alphaproteobacteria bacterium]
MAVLNFKRRTPVAPVSDGTLASFLNGFSIEVMPRTAAKIEDFRKILPEGTRVYIAHLDGTPIEEMVETAKRLNAEGFPVMPHFPARIIADRAMLEEWIKRYADVGVSQALLLAGGVDNPLGDFEDSMQLLSTGLFDKHGFGHLHVAGHPEGNKDID